jgi:hypothetical protein
MKIVKTILQQMSTLSQPQRQFMQVLLPLLICQRGRANFRNLSRYSDYHEKMPDGVCNDKMPDGVCNPVRNVCNPLRDILCF